jgi:hypothetical protein
MKKLTTIGSIATLGMLLIALNVGGTAGCGSGAAATAPTASEASTTAAVSGAVNPALTSALAAGTQQGLRVAALAVKSASTTVTLDSTTVSCSDSGSATFSGTVTVDVDSDPATFSGNIDLDFNACAETVDLSSYVDGCEVSTSIDGTITVSYSGSVSQSNPDDYTVSASLTGDLTVVVNGTSSDVVLDWDLDPNTGVITGTTTIDGVESDASDLSVFNACPAS